MSPSPDDGHRLAACRGPSEPPPPPDILLVTIDTLRADALEPYGAVETLTPNIVHLAEEGVVYEAVTSPIPLTRPAQGARHLVLADF